jgi:hypothetical protein
MFEAIVAHALVVPPDEPDVVEPPDTLVPDVFTGVPLLEMEPLPPPPAGNGSSPVQDEKAATVPSATKGAQPSR